MKRTKDERGSLLPNSTDRSTTMIADTAFAAAVSPAAAAEQVADHATDGAPSARRQGPAGGSGQRHAGCR